jgi:hypothetical protein
VNTFRQGLQSSKEEKRKLFLNEFKPEQRLKNVLVFGTRVISDVLYFMQVLNTEQDMGPS